MRRYESHDPHPFRYRPAAQHIQARDEPHPGDECDACGAASLAVLDASDDDFQDSNEYQLLEMSTSITWHPSAMSKSSYPDVPPIIAAVATEAYGTWSVGANRAAVLLARAVIEATAKDHQILKGSLAQKLDELLAQQIIDPLTHEAATEVRHIGNEMAHGDFADPVEAVDAQAILRFMGMVLHDAYQRRAEIARIRSACERKTKTA